MISSCIDSGRSSQRVGSPDLGTELATFGCVGCIFRLWQKLGLVLIYSSSLIWAAAQESRKRRIPSGLFLPGHGAHLIVGHAGSVKLLLTSLTLRRRRRANRRASLNL